jgi:hypothetical protein
METHLGTQWVKHDWVAAMVVDIKLGNGCSPGVARNQVAVCCSFQGESPHIRLANPSKLRALGGEIPKFNKNIPSAIVPVIQLIFLNRPSAEGLPVWSDHSQVAVAIDEVLPLAKLGHPGGSDVNGFPKLKAIQLTQDVNSKSSTGH